MLKNILRGTGVAIITPFKNSGEVDYNALNKLIEFQLANGVNYFVSLGTTGETPVLSAKEKAEVVNFTCDTVDNRVPLVIGVGGNCTQVVIDELGLFDHDRCAAILSAAPYYNKPSQEGIFRHYKAISEASPLPVILYNVPSRTGKNMEAETTIRLAKECKNIGGIKEASGDMVQCMEILKNCPDDFLVVSGDDALALPQLACGMDGVISVAANCFPQEFAKMVHHALNNNLPEAIKINNLLLPAYKLLFGENNPGGVKAFLYEMGRIENVLRLPCVPVTENLQKQIYDYTQNSKNS